jgi:hypothetical protein
MRIFFTRLLLVALCLLGWDLIFPFAEARAQSSTSVEDLGSIPVAQVENGLGFNVHGNLEWEFQMAHDAGATEVRWQPAWVAVETKPGQFALPASSEAALGWCAKYSLHPLLVAAYAPPSPKIAELTLARDVPAGAKDIAVTEDTSGIHPPACHVMLKSAAKRQIVPEGKWAYYGALIDSVDNATRTLHLAAATSVPLAKGDALVVNQLFYPSCATSDPHDPSIVAYGRYVSFLAGRIAAYGLQGRVEIWNEPPWKHDEWDCRALFYDKGTAPAGLNRDCPNFGLAEMLVNLPAPPGVHYNWGGSHKSGFRSLYSKYMKQITPEQTARTFDSESFHPYGNSPEDAAWDPAALAAQPLSAWIRTGLPGTSWPGNFKSAHKLLLLDPALGVKQNVTETGTEITDGAQKARFCLRQYLAFLGIGIERVTFFCFSTPGAVSFGFVDQKTQAPTQAYTALKDLLVTDVAKLPVAALPDDPARPGADLPTVPTYQGTYPLDTVSVVGRHAIGDKRNAILFVAWQRSMPPPGPATKFTATATDGKVTLSWSPNSYASLTPPSNVSTVSRAVASGGPYAPIATLPTNPDMKYVDAPPGPGTYYYIVTGSNPAGAGSASNEIAVTLAAAGDGTVNNASRPPGLEQASWKTIASPAAASINVQLPAGCTATKAWDLVTRAPVPMIVNGATVTYPVADDPVCLEVEAAP